MWGGAGVHRRWKHSWSGGIPYREIWGRPVPTLEWDLDWCSCNLFTPASVRKPSKLIGSSSWTGVHCFFGLSPLWAHISPGKGHDRRHCRGSWLDPGFLSSVENMLSRGVWDKGHPACLHLLLHSLQAQAKEDVESITLAFDLTGPVEPDGHFECVHTCACRLTCDGQRTVSGVSPQLPRCLRCGLSAARTAACQASWPPSFGVLFPPPALLRQGWGYRLSWHTSYPLKCFFTIEIITIWGRWAALVCHGMEVRGQLCGVSTLFPPLQEF